MWILNEQYYGLKSEKRKKNLNFVLTLTNLILETAKIRSKKIKAEKTSSIF